MQDTRHIWNKPTTSEQNLWQQKKEGTGCLEDIFMDVSSTKHKRILNAYASGRQMKILCNDKWHDSTYNNPTPQSQGADSITNVPDSKPDCVTKNDEPKNIIITSSQDSTKHDIRTRSGWISCRPERLGIQTY